MDVRRSPRRSVVLPVLLSGTDFTGQTFQENTWTIGVNRHGAKISTSYRLTVGDQVMVGNPVLGHSAKARVTWVTEKGNSFEIGVELLEPQDVWGAKIPPENWAASNASSENGSGSTTADAAPRAAQNPGSGLSPLLEVAGASGNTAAPAVASSQRRDTSDSATGPEEGAHKAPEDRTSSSQEPRWESVASFLRDSRAELNGLLAKAQEIQSLSSQAVQSLLESVHLKLHQELEAAAASFARDTGRRIQQVASAALETFGKEVRAQQTSLLEDALTRSRATHQEIERSLKQGVEEAQKKLAESSGSALEEFQHKGTAFFDDSRTELQKILDDLRKKAADEVSEHLRTAVSELATEMRRRADVGFEILNEQLWKSARALIEETQKHVAALNQSALADLSHKASDAVQQELNVGVSALNEAAWQAKASLDTNLQQALETFQKEISKLTKDALEKNNRTSELLLHDLQSRLDQAARALQLKGMESASANKGRLSD